MVRSTKYCRTGVQVVVGVERPQRGLAGARLEVAQEQVYRALLLVIVPALGGKQHTSKLKAALRRAGDQVAFVTQLQAQLASALTLHC